MLAIFSVSENTENRADHIILADNSATDFGRNIVKESFHLLMICMKWKVKETHESVSGS